MNNNISITELENLQFDNFLREEFPQIELCYEMINHNKVHSYDIALAIPKGKKQLLWFTSYKESNICVVFNVSRENNKSQLSYSHILDFDFSGKLAIGTMLLGMNTYIHHQQSKYQCFFIEDIYYHMGLKMSGKSYVDKLTVIKNILKKNELPLFSNYIYLTKNNHIKDSIQTIKTKYLEKTTILFGLPIMSTSLENLTNNIIKLPYSILHIQYRFLSYSNKIIIQPMIKNKNIINTQKNITYKPKRTKFLVRATTKQDIYNLYFPSDKLNENLQGHAHIATFEEHNFMNQIFSKHKNNIPYNNDINDWIVESDDEEDFNNDSESKHIDLNKCVLMEFEFVPGVSRWKPLNGNKSMCHMKSLMEVDI